MEETNTIVALSSGKGNAAIAVIRLSGSKAIQIVDSCLSSKNLLSEKKSKTINVFSFLNPDDDSIVDQITAVKYDKPNSFTGENMVEIFCHGGEIIVEKIILMLLKKGAIYAEKGEFTRRAFLNKKFDLLQAESIAQMIDSKTEREYRKAIKGYFGGYKNVFLKWKESIIKILIDIEAAIEFSEEDDIKKNNDNGEIKILKKIIKEIESEVNKKEKAKIIEKGINIPIVGVPNAGKSSLFNLILECDRSIVHWEEGTTRDTISEEITIGNEKIRLIDTAGLRETNNIVELQGIKKTNELISNAPIVVWVTPANINIDNNEVDLIKNVNSERIICIQSKVDLGINEEKNKWINKKKIKKVESCLLNNINREILIDFISTEIRERIGSIEIPEFIRNKRQEECALKIAEYLKNAEQTILFQQEICAQYLKKALEQIGNFVGDITNEEVLNRIFSEFCIGK